MPRSPFPTKREMADETRPSRRPSDSASTGEVVLSDEEVAGIQLGEAFAPS